jgi:hypothetical protein
MFRRRIHAVVAFALTVVLNTAQGGDKSRPITDADVEPYRRELEKHLRVVEADGIRPQDVIALYERRAREKAPPREAAIHAYIYASLLRIIERRKEARAEMQRAIGLWPRHAPAHLQLGRMAEGVGDRREAKRLIRKALDFAPRYVMAMLEMGRFARLEGNLEEAKHWYERSFEVKFTPEACWGLGRVCVVYFRKSYSEKKKKEYARRAAWCAERLVDLDSGSGVGHLRRAQIYRDLDQIAKAAKSLEASYKDQIAPQVRFLCLSTLLDLYAQMRDIKKVEGVLERLLKHEGLKAEVRERYKKMLRELRERGELAFVIWAAEQQMERLKNEGISPTDRRVALRMLLTFYIDEMVVTDPTLRALRLEILETIFRVLTTAPPKISTEVFHFLRTKYPDPHLLRILVHFVYPYSDATRTPKVRVEAVRTMARAAEVAAIPTLIYCLNDESGRVVREVDKALTRLCEVRSPVGEGIKALSAEEAKRARIAWREYFQTEDGVERLKEAFVELRKYAEMNDQLNRQPTNKPIAKHVANTILLDNDMPWEAWKAAYEFLADYLNKEFRPVKRRGKPVEESERAAIAREIDAFWKDEEVRLPEPTPPKDEVTQDG